MSVRIDPSAIAGLEPKMGERTFKEKVQGILSGRPDGVGLTLIEDVPRHRGETSAGSGGVARMSWERRRSQQARQIIHGRMAA